MSDGKKVNLEPPFIFNQLESFLFKVSFGQPAKLEDLRKFDMTQGFYAGFAEGYAMARAVMEQLSYEDQKMVWDEIAKELKIVSEANRELGKKLGLGHISLSKTLAEQFPDRFKGS